MLAPEDLAQMTVIVTASEERINARIERSVEANAAATQAEVKAAEQRFNARIEHVETALLTEFHKWASPLEALVRTHAAAIRAI